MYMPYTWPVSQLNINMTPELEADLKRLMKARGLKTKAEAVRIAVREALERARRADAADFASWIGIGNAAPANPNPRFTSDDALWRER
jgi:Arc/MetJ family transcription regulator